MESIMTKKKKKGKLVTFGISLIVLFFVWVMCIQIKDSREELKSLELQQQKLQQQMDDAIEEAEKLEERRVYVKTKKYVEEVAKQVGYVYPDEIIYKPEE